MKTTTKCYATSAPGVEPPINGARVLCHLNNYDALFIARDDGLKLMYYLGELDRIIVREEVEE